MLDLRSLDKHAASILHLIIECTVPDLCSLVEHTALISHLIIECTVLDLPVPLHNASAHSDFDACLREVDTFRCFCRMVFRLSSASASLETKFLG